MFRLLAGQQYRRSHHHYNDTYPVLDGWILEPDEVGGVISTAPALVNIDSDLYLEIIVLTGNTLSAFEEDGSVIWTITEEGFTCGSQVLATDLTGNGKSEFILASDEGIKIVDSDGDVLQTIQIMSESFVLEKWKAPRDLSSAQLLATHSISIHGTLCRTLRQ